MQTKYAFEGFAKAEVIKPRARTTLEMKALPRGLQPVDGGSVAHRTERPGGSQPVPPIGQEQDINGMETMRLGR
jgi:hypothetical protein